MKKRGLLAPRSCPGRSCSGCLRHLRRWEAPCGRVRRPADRGHGPAPPPVGAGPDDRGWPEAGKQKETRVAIDGPSGAYDDDPEQAGDSKPEKDPGHGKQQPAEIRSRAEYYEELRATDKQMAAADGHSDRPPLDSLHVTPERAKHILDGDRWGGGHRHGTGRARET